MSRSCLPTSPSCNCTPRMLFLSRDRTFWVSVIHAEVTQRLHQECKKLLLGIKKDEQCESLRPVWDFVHTQCQILSTAKFSDDLFFSLVARCMAYWGFNNNSDANSREFKELISNTIEFVTGRQDSTAIKENVQKGWDDEVFDEPESFARFLFDNQTIAGGLDQYSLTFCVLLVRKDSGDLFSNKEITSYFNDPESLKVAANTSANGRSNPRVFIYRSTSYCREITYHLFKW